MIDERAVLAAKFWGALRQLRALSGLREGEYEEFALTVLGLSCMRELHDYWADEPFEHTASRLSKVFDDLREARDENRFQSAWYDAHKAMTDVLQTRGRIEPQYKSGSSDAFSGIVRLLDNYSSKGPRRELLLECFDEVFHRVVGRLAAIGYRSGDTAAALAAHLSAGTYRIAEYFTSTGEFAVIRRSTFNVETAAQISVIDSLHFFVDLRLYLHGIHVEHQSNYHVHESFSANRFMLVDHPLRNVAGQRSQPRRWADQKSSLEALDNLLQSHSLTDMSLVVVPGVDRSAGGWRNELRKYLVNSGLLIAVIDLPLGRGEKGRKQVSAWLLSRRQRISNSVLMVNAKSLIGRGELREVNHLMAFVAAIVAVGATEDGALSGFERYGQSNSDVVEAMLAAYFKDGYRDVDGICKRVRALEVANNGYKLAASFYVGQVERGKKFRPLLNSDPILEALGHGHAHRTRIYVIGNNGEGKSILLGDLAERLTQQGKRVVGISFGLTDRFPFERPQSDGQTFIYVGARTSERSIALARTSADLIRMVRDIHLSDYRLEVFNALVGYLGFGDRRYLVPLDLKSSLDDDRARYAELQQLTESANENALIFQDLMPSKYVLGLMRKDSESSITTFGELSSGEQQLLTLAVKLTAYAGENTVILVDEPELSLHVSWQRAIPVMLEIVSLRLDCSIVVATHSPVIVASATHNNDKCFVARQHTLVELNSRQRRSVETALFDGFRTYTANNRQVHERCASMVSQAIQRLNSQSLGQDGEAPTVEALQKELELMDRIIRLADSAQLSNAREDLELVARTKAALEELNAIERGKVG
jgi:predicted ATPase